MLYLISSHSLYYRFAELSLHLAGSTHGLRVDEMPMKGRGVVADKNFVRGEFVIEYDGDLISFDKAKKRLVVLFWVDSMRVFDRLSLCYT